MIEHATLPAEIEPAHYQPLYVRYVGQLLKAAGVRVTYDGNTHCGFHQFMMQLDGRQVVVDYNDHKELPPNNYPELPRLKFSYCREHLPPDGRLYPFPPMTFDVWGKRERVRGRIKYGDGDRVLFAQAFHRNQPPYYRRRLVASILKEAFGARAPEGVVPIEDYWLAINEALVRVFAPGSRDDMLDRGHAQYLSFGCATIAPPLATVLPWYRPIEPWVHYIPCHASFNDLVDKVFWCERHPEARRRIGANAARLFEETCAPDAVLRWLAFVLEDTECS